ncbi:ATP-binding protein [Paracoccaceae bacterium Fryx2]|nr:ATP-binding protein [Paracoccaceae bacterium Fryx2]
MLKGQNQAILTSDRRLLGECRVTELYMRFRGAKFGRTSSAQVIRRDMECSAKLHLAMLSAASHLSHEMNQSLGAIGNYAGTILRRVVASDAHAIELIEITEAIQTEVKRTADVIATMRSVIGNVDDAVKIDDFRMIVRTALKQIETCLSARQSAQIRLEAEYPETAAKVRGSPAVLTYALFCLLINSVEALEYPWTGLRVITIRMQVEDDLIDLTIADTGPGIRQDIKPTLFSAFATSKPGHLGLGLAIARDILNGYGGSIISVPQSEGASFNILFPIFDGDIP